MQEQLTKAIDEFEQLSTKPDRLKSKIDTFNEAISKLVEVIAQTRQVIDLLSREKEMELSEKLGNIVRPVEEFNMGNIIEFRHLFLFSFLFVLFVCFVLLSYF